MATKQVRKQKQTLKKERLERWTEVASLSMDLGFTTKAKIAQDSGLKLWELNELFEENKDIYKRYCTMRKTLVDTAADNLEDILKNPDHPQHFAASKYILQTYKSDLDSNFETKTKDNVGVEIGIGGKGNRPVILTFEKRS